MTKDAFSKVGTGKKAPEEVNVIVEIPKGSHNKYEYDEKRQVFKMDRVIHSPLHYPADYGFVPGTRAADGDPLDILVVGGDPTFPGCLLKVRPIGLLRMFDEGEEDFKILGVQADNPRLTNINTIEDMENQDPHFLKEVVHFFEEYKKLEGKKVIIKGWEGKSQAFEEIERTKI